ncbi:hypothetical protein BSKO_05399 [Bryopsis sp. KO-2023]|nr:hypothetical protein BSKO_05399 [Bryopsis sp. KO-2023]
MLKVGPAARRAFSQHSFAGVRGFTSDYFGPPVAISPRRVVVTGLGLVTPLGVGVEQSWRRLIDGESGVRRLTEEDLFSGHAQCLNQLPSKVVARVSKDELKACEWAPEQESRRSGLFMKFAAIAAEEALRNANWKPDNPEDKINTGVAIGCGMSFTTEVAEAGLMLGAGTLRRLSPFFVPKVLGNMASGDVSVRYGFKGPNLSASTACAASAHAIGDAFRAIQLGDANVMVAGGTEACIDAIALMGFSRMRALSTKFNDQPHKASRPFDAERDGFVMGEGAGILILEELSHARHRGAQCLAEMRGYGASGDGHHITQPVPSGEGAALAMSRCIRGSGVRLEDITYLNAHATSTPKGDEVELNAISTVFGLADRPPLMVSSVKGSLGHLLGAAGAVETAMTVLSLHHGIAPHTVNLETPSPTPRHANLIMHTPHPTAEGPTAVMSNSFGFAGTNASLLLTTPPPQE